MSAPSLRGDDVAVIVGLRTGTEVTGMTVPGPGWRDVLAREKGFENVRLLEAA